MLWFVGVFADEGVGITALDYAPAERSLRDRFRAPSPKPQTNALQETLQYLQRLMERKDNQRFFAFPINDMIAPDYSTVSDGLCLFVMLHSRHSSSIQAYMKSFSIRPIIGPMLMCKKCSNLNEPPWVF